ncbi:hypothetical protein F5B18DRAFT_209232 [Nemania serpens]|nr:hypothetical protein F5B18DRAFT_209232 [Nemania serpens]
MAPMDGLGSQGGWVGWLVGWLAGWLSGSGFEGWQCVMAFWLPRAYIPQSLFGSGRASIIPVLCRHELGERIRVPPDQEFHITECAKRQKGCHVEGT